MFKVQECKLVWYVKPSVVANEDCLSWKNDGIQIAVKS